MDNTPRKNATIDYLKFVSAVIVVFLHTVEQKKIAVTGLMHLVTQGFHYAIWLVNPVEIFLLTSGFYFFRSSYDFENNCFNSIKYKRKLKHYIMLYLGWSVLYIPNILVRIISLLSDGKSAITIILYIFKKVFVSGTTGIMWYMLGVIYALIALFILLKFFKDYCVLIFTFILYCVSLLGSSYYHLLNGYYAQNLFDTVLKFTGSFYLLRAPIFMMIGYYLNKYAHKRGKCTIKPLLYLIPLYVVSVGALFFERHNCIEHSLGIEYPAFMMSILAPTLLFLICQNYHVDGNAISGFFGSCSSFIYFTHWQILTIFGQTWGGMVLCILLGMLGNGGYIAIQSQLKKSKK